MRHATEERVLAIKHLRAVLRPDNLTLTVEDLAAHEVTVPVSVSRRTVRLF